MSAWGWVCAGIFAVGLVALPLIRRVSPTPATAQRPAPEPVALDTLVVPPPLATVSYVGTTPTLENAGTCEAPAYRATTRAMSIRWEWTGAAPGSGRLDGYAPGARFRITVPASAESLRVRAEFDGLTACDTAVAVRP
jgi:hypothetical protein